MTRTATAARMRAYDRRDLERDAIPRLRELPEEQRHAMRVVASVLPFRVNNYVVDELIDWSRVPEDPIFQLTFPQRDMLEPEAFAAIEKLLQAGAPDAQVRAAARAIQHDLNPHPAGQVELNVPRDESGEPVAGVQHKYRETVLFFPAQGQTCHSYCTYCFRWPQFVGLDELKFASREAGQLASYLRTRPEVTSVLFTGGDPLVMRTSVLERYLEPLLDGSLPHLASIRLGSKALAWWPGRFLTDPDADDLLRLFERVVRSGKTLAFMAHSSYPRELETPAAQAAVRRILSTGAIIRTQSPVIRHVNDDARAWAELWRLQVQLGMQPYYMFVARDTGARRYFEVPLARAVGIYRHAMMRVSGLARTARGPSMSATPGKVAIDGVAEVRGERVFVLRFLQARDPLWVGRPFFAKYDDRAAWLDQLQPAFDEDRFFFEDAMRAMKAAPNEDHGWKAQRIRRRALPIFAPGQEPVAGAVAEDARVGDGEEAA